MASARFRNILLTFLLVLGVFLGTRDFGALLHVLLHPGLGGAEGGHHLFGLMPGALTALFGISLFALFRSMARDRQRATGQSQADKARIQAEWQQTFNALPDFVSVHDRDFRILNANSALCEFLGKKQEEIIGRYCFQLFHDRDTPVDGCPHRKAQGVGHAVTMEVDDAHLGVPLLITCSPFVDAQGGFAGSVHIARIQTARSVSPPVAPHLFIPICASCKDIRDERGNWLKIEDYVRLRFHGLLTHSICGKCQKKIYPQLFQD